MKYLTEENIEKLRTGYLEIPIKMAKLMEQLLNLEDRLQFEDSKKFCRYGINRRLKAARRCLLEFSDIFEDEAAGKEISDDQRFEQTAFLNFYFMCISGSCDNVAQVVASENKLKMRKEKVSLFNKEFRKYLPPRLNEKLREFGPWIKHFKDFRNNSAHGVQPYVPPYFVVGAEDGEVIYDSYYVHDIENPKMAAFHPQVLADGNTLCEILTILLEDDISIDEDVIENIHLNSPMSLEGYLKADKEKVLESRSLLDNHLQYFSDTNEMYFDLFKATRPETFSEEPSRNMQFLFHQCLTDNLSSAAALLRGHSPDSLMYGRRVAESLRYAAFIRENPQHSGLVQVRTKDDNNKLRAEYSRWLNNGGRETLENELPTAKKMFEFASNFGSHGNLNLPMQKLGVDEVPDGGVKINLFTHDFYEDQKDMLTKIFFIHLNLHCESIEWWRLKSGFNHALSSQRARFWVERKNQIQKAIDSLNPYN